MKSKLERKGDRLEKVGGAGKKSVVGTVILSLLVLGCFGQGVPPANNDAWNDRIQQMSFVSRGESDYKLGTGDLIEVSVFGVEDYNYALRINSRGQVNLPLLGTLTASGLTPAELEQDLRMRFESGLINKPQVSVFVKEYRSQPVFILGAVKQPGQYQMIHQLYLVDIIAMAGGLDTDKAADYALIQSRSQEGRFNMPALEGTKPTLKTNVQEIDLRALLEKGDLNLNVPIKGGDVIHVPERKVDFFYVVGEVNKPGAFEVPHENEVFVSQAVTWAGGPLPTAKMKDGILVRYDGQGTRQEMAVNFDHIIRGKDPDFLVQANDIVFIPGSGAKKLAQGLLQVIPATISGAIIWGAIR